MFRIANLKLKSPEIDLGKWEFIDLPKDGDYLAVKINDEATVFQVDAIIHSPVKFPPISETKQVIPSVLVLVTKPELQAKEI